MKKQWFFSTLAIFFFASCANELLDSQFSNQDNAETIQVTDDLLPVMNAPDMEEVRRIVRQAPHTYGRNMQIVILDCKTTKNTFV